VDERQSLHSRYARRSSAAVSFAEESEDTLQQREAAMRTRLNLTIIAVAIALCACVLTLQAQQRAAVANQAVWAPAQPVVTFAGSYSGVDQREYERIMLDDIWQEVWVRHAGSRLERDSYDQVVAPIIDFDNHMVMAIFNGQAWNTRNMFIAETAEVDGELHIRFDAGTYQTASLDMGEPIVIEGELTPEKIADATRKQLEESAKEREAAKKTDPNYTTAYGMFVLPRTDKPIVLFENVQGLIGEPPIWKEKHRFAAVK